MTGTVRTATALCILVVMFQPSIGPFFDGGGESIEASSSILAADAQYAYRDYSGIRNAMLGIEGQHSNIARIVDIGDSWEKTQGLADRDILAIKISDNVDLDEDEPEVLILGLHHAREWTTSELTLMIADNLTDRYGNDSRISWLVDNREIWIIPVVNPDGLDYALTHDQWWRKNRRLNDDGTYGVDLNRNYNGTEGSDLAGAWGGAGSSNVTSDDTYHGKYPFSEPETQAIRDLVLQHNFSIAIDFHSYGQWVMWPWGYTTATTNDDADLQRIGREMAAMNGYYAAQSIQLYATTGDSLDWLYGAADIYAFCFEVGNVFHPAKSDDVWGIIHNNIPPAMTAIETAGDRESRNLTISHNPVSARLFDTAGFELNASVSADRGVNSSSVDIRYRVDSFSWQEIGMTSVGGDLYSAVIPATYAGSVIEYYFLARDVGGVLVMAPKYAPYECYSFLVTPENGGPVVEFAPPSTVEGSVGGALRANVTNMSEPFELTLHLENITSGTFSNMSMVPTGQSYSCMISPGSSLGNYHVWLTMSSNGSDVWASDIHSLTIVDWVAPTIKGHSLQQYSPGSVSVALDCQDIYGVHSVRMMYRLDGVPDSALMSLSSGDLFNGTWTVDIDGGAAQLMDFSFAANDSRQASFDPVQGDWYQYSLMQPIPEIAYASLVCVFLAGVVILIHRTRRK